MKDRCRFYQSKALAKICTVRLVLVRADSIYFFNLVLLIYFSFLYFSEEPRSHTCDFGEEKKQVPLDWRTEAYDVGIRYVEEPESNDTRHI